MIQARHFNTITILNDKVIRKTSIDIKKIIAEYRWLTSPQIYQTPKAFNLIINTDSASYDMEYIHGRTLADLFVNEILSVHEFSKIFKFLADAIDTIRLKGVSSNDINNISIVKELYKNKTIFRLKNYGINLNREYILNDQNIGSLNDIINDSDVYVFDDELGYIHGDLCFSNIILSDEYFIKRDSISKYLYFIDPRGILLNGEINQTGDIKYEIAKLAHSVIGKYDFIKADKFNVKKINSNNYSISDIKFSDYELGVEKAFDDAFMITEQIYDIMVHLFLSMIPLHCDNELHQDAMLANALRIYIKKIELFK